jgi:phage terminase large subunit-like protein
MTRNDLKDLIKQVIVESRVRSSPMGYNASIRAAAEKFKQQQSDKDAISKADDEKLAQLKPVSSISRAVNIMARINQLSDRIKALEDQIPKRDHEDEAEYYERVVEVLKEKTQLEIDRLDYVLNLENMNK